MNFHPPFFSVLMPTYNEGWYIRDAIESILTQTFQDFELIIVDDGSTDDTPDHIAAYPDGRIRVITFPENRGRPHARNTALDAAIGKYIAWMDSDDIALPDRLAKQYAFMEAHPRIAASSGALMVFSRASGVRVVPSDNASIRAGLFWGATINNPTSCLRRETIIKTGVRFDKTLMRAQDYDFWCSLLLDHNLQAANIQDVLLLHRLHKNEPYKTLHDVVLRKNLKRLDIPDNDETMALYSYLSHADDTESRFPIENIADWMRDVLHRNSIKQVFPRQKLELSLCYKVLHEAGKISSSKGERLKILWHHLELSGFSSLLKDIAVRRTVRKDRRT